MIAAAYLLIIICVPDKECGRQNEQSITSRQFPQSNMGNCISMANSINTNRSDMRAVCVRGSEK